VQPERRRHRRRLSQYAADSLSVRGEQLVSAKLGATSDGLTPAEQVAVEPNRPLAIFGEEFVPANPAFGTRFSGRLRPRAPSRRVLDR
jgi:hypothetical protein